MKIDPYCQ